MAETAASPMLDLSRFKHRIGTVALALLLTAPLVYLGIARENPHPSRPTPGSDALQVAKIAAAATPSHDTLLNLSLHYHLNSQFQESIEASQRALEFRPDSWAAYNNLCTAYSALGMWDKAIAAGLKAVELNPNEARPRNNLAGAMRGKAASESTDRPRQ